VNFQTSIRALFAALLLALLARPLRAELNQPAGSDAPRPDPAASIEMARETLSKYFETQKLISKEKTDWKLAKELLEDRVNLMKSELESLRQKTEEERKKTTEADRQREELVKQNEELKAAAVLLEEKASALEEGILAFSPRLPVPLADKIKPLKSRIPAIGSESKASLAERYQNALGILNEVVKFNTDIVLVTERRSLGTNREVEVESLYLGLGQAFYAAASASSKLGGTGVAGPNGFEWMESRDAVPEIRGALGIYKGKQTAAFVQLPVTIK
jgi:hypothetical protein